MPALPQPRAIGGLTRKQRQLLAFIRLYLAENDGVSPSFDEMMLAMGMKSKSEVHRVIVALVERGRITRMESRARSIELVGGPISEYARGYAAGYRDAFDKLGHSTQSLSHTAPLSKRPRIILRE